MSKGVIKAVAKILVCAVLALVVLAIAGFVAMIYFSFFRATFVRHEFVQSDADDLRYYATEDNVKQHYADVAWFEAQNPREIEATSFDGLRLVASLLEADEGKGVAILMHGFHSEPLREFATIARVYHDAGYTVILPYHRAHGKSEGRFLTFGIKERRDCATWVDVAVRLYGEECDIFLHGISMGCASVLMASGLDLPHNVRAIVADCGFTSPYDITYWTCLQRGVEKPEGAMKLCGVFARRLAGFDLTEYSTLEAMAVNTIPVLFITGTEDKRVPMEMTMRNYTACAAPKQLVLIEGSPHAINYFWDPAKYNAAVLAFLLQYGSQGE